MADVNATRAGLLSLFKELYGEKVAEQPNRTAWIYNLFDNSSRRYGGKYWTVPMHDEGGQAVGSYNETEEVADAQAETAQEIRIYPRQHYGLVNISGLAIAASKGNLFAFVQAKDFEIRNKIKWLISQLNVQFYGQGKGQLGIVLSSEDTNDTITFVVGTNMNWFRKGMKFDVYDTTLATKRNTAGKKGGMQVESVAKATRVVTLVGDVNPSGTFSIVSTDVATFEDAIAVPAPTDAAGKQILGLASLVDDYTEGLETVQNINRTTYPIFNATRLHNSGTNRPMSLDLLQTLIDEIEIASGETCDFMVGGYGQRRNYLNLLWYDVRYAPTKLTGGFETLKYNNLNWVVDKDCQNNRIYAGVRSELHKFVIQPLGILDEAGAQMERVTKKDLYELLIGGYINLGMERPNTWGKLLDLDEP